MKKLFAGIAICAAFAAAAPAWAVAPDAAQTPQIYLRETRQVTAQAHLIFKDDSAESAVEGNAVVVEHSQGLVMVSTVGATPGVTSLADLRTVPASPVHTTTTATISWTPARASAPSRTF